MYHQLNLRRHNATRLMHHQLKLRRPNTTRLIYHSLRATTVINTNDLLTRTDQISSHKERSIFFNQIQFKLMVTLEKFLFIFLLFSVRTILHCLSEMHVSVIQFLSSFSVIASY